MTSRLAAVAVFACVLAAGCTGPLGGDSTDAPTADAPTTDDAGGERVVAAPPSTTSPTNQTTAAAAVADRFRIHESVSPDRSLYAMLY